MDRLNKAFASGEVLKTCWLGMRDPQYIANMARFDFDAAVLDAQHGYLDESSILAGIAEIVHAGKSPIVRIPIGRWDLAERAMDFGALSVVAPMINNKADAERFAASVKYPPNGSRSHGPGGAIALYKADPVEYMSTINENSYAFAMIETREAYENLDEIISVEGIDGILIGPGDFSISLRGDPVPDAYGVDSIKQVTDIANRVNAIGKIPTAFAMTPKHANLVHSLGFKLITIGCDDTYLAKGAEFHLDLDF
ncbi:MAG: aldolase/citrate lyase family protein [Rhizobiaceae bacterium]